MIKKTTPILLILWVLGGSFVSYSAVIPSTKKSLNPNFDLSSVKKFWPVMEILLQDREPTARQWQELFNSTGHNTLRREFKDEFFKKYLRAAYMPGQVKIKEGMIKDSKKATGWFARWFPKAEFEALEWTLKNRKKVEAEIWAFENYPFTELATKEALNTRLYASTLSYSCCRDSR